jgi:hypothetical protein
VYGQNLDSIYVLSNRVKAALEGIPGVKDLYVDPITGGKYLTIDINREALGRYGLTVDDVNTIVESAIGGSPIGQTIEGRQRFSISARLAQDYRNSIEQLNRIPIKTQALGSIPLSSVATIKFEDGPPMITSENAMLRGAVLFNVRDRDLGSTVKEAIETLNEKMGIMPNGYYVEWSGQYENLIRGQQTLMMILPVVLLVIFVSLYLAFKSIREAFFSLITVPFALDWRCLHGVLLRCEFVGGRCRGLHRLVWYCCGDGRCNDYLSERCHAAVGKTSWQLERNYFNGRAERICNCRSSETPSPENHDGKCGVVWLGAGVVGNGSGQRCDAANCVTHDWRGAHLFYAHPAGNASHLFDDERI